MPITPSQNYWAQETLHSLGYTIQNGPHVVRDRPWSCVSCFNTSQGTVYLKSMAAPYSNEPILLQFLKDQGIENITKVIVLNNALSCFLMGDSGQPLRDKQTSTFKPDLFYQYLKLYAAIQIDCIHLVNDILALGVNDWRLEKLPNLYKKFVQNQDILLKDGLSLSELYRLQQLAPMMRILCEELAAYGIPETIEHGDFHDNNILIREDKITINDWGDASISHPFFSLAAALDSAKRNHNLQKTDNTYLKARDVYLNQWQDFGKQDTLLRAFEIAQKLHRFVFAMSFSRINSCPGIENFPKFNGYIADSMRELLETL